MSLLRLFSLFIFFYIFSFLFLYFLYIFSSFFPWDWQSHSCNFSPSGYPDRFLTPALAQSSTKSSTGLKKSYIATIYLYISSGHYQLFLAWGRVCQHTQSLCHWSLKRDFPCNIVNWLTFRPGKNWEYQSSNIFSCFSTEGHINHRNVFDSCLVTAPTIEYNFMS